MCMVGGWEWAFCGAAVGLSCRSDFFVLDRPRRNRTETINAQQSLLKVGGRRASSSIYTNIIITVHLQLTVLLSAVYVE